MKLLAKIYLSNGKNLLFQQSVFCSMRSINYDNDTETTLTVEFESGSASYNINGTTGGLSGEATAGTDLTGYTLLLLNGNGGSVYQNLSLSGIIPDQDSSGFGTLWVGRTQFYTLVYRSYYD